MIKGANFWVLLRCSALFLFSSLVFAGGEQAELLYRVDMLVTKKGIDVVVVYNMSNKELYCSVDSGGYSNDFHLKEYRVSRAYSIDPDDYTVVCTAD